MGPGLLPVVDEGEDTELGGIAVGLAGVALSGAVFPGAALPWVSTGAVVGPCGAGAVVGVCARATPAVNIIAAEASKSVRIVISSVCCDELQRGRRISLSQDFAAHRGIKPSSLRRDVSNDSAIGWRRFCEKLGFLGGGSGVHGAALHGV
jgi:hypothetical protein